MRTRLSELEQLRLEKKTLLEECKLYEDSLKDKIDYTKSNFGHLLLNSVISSVKTGFADLTKPSSKESKKKDPNSMNVGKIFVAATPFIWEIIQPLLIGLAIKKTKSIFTKKRKK